MITVTNSFEDKFEATWGTSWEAALEAGAVLNATESATKMGVDADGLEVEWRKLEAEAVKPVKFGGGFYVGQFPAAEGR